MYMYYMSIYTDTSNGSKQWILQVWSHYIYYHTIRFDIVGLVGSLTSSGLSCTVLTALVVNGCDGLGGGGLCTFDAESYETIYTV